MNGHVSLLTVKDAADVIDRDVRTIRRWIADGALPTMWGKVWERDLIAARDSARSRQRAGGHVAAGTRVGKRIEATGDAGREEILRAIASAVVDIDNRENVDFGTLTVRAQRVEDWIEVDVAAMSR